MGTGQIIEIIKWSIKVAIPTTMFLVSMNLLIVSHKRWEERLGSLLGFDDLEVSKTSFIVLKIFASLLLLGSLGVVYLLFIM
ncbi:MAG: hypothetical protein AAFX93_04355 [Verrucomicrobiota bacterium]